VLDRARTARSSDSWTVLGPRPRRGRRGGGLHLLFRHSLDHWTSEVSYLRYGYWNGEAWSAFEPILDMDDVRAIDMVQDDQGTVHLIFVARELSQERSRLYLVRAGADS
jgi:hypothetical protein